MACFCRVVKLLIFILEKGIGIGFIKEISKVYKSSDLTTLLTSSCISLSSLINNNDCGDEGAGWAVALPLFAPKSVLTREHRTPRPPN